MAVNHPFLEQMNGGHSVIHGGNWGQIIHNRGPRAGVDPWSNEEEGGVACSTGGTPTRRLGAGASPTLSRMGVVWVAPVTDS